MNGIELNLVYVHLGNKLPTYIFDSIYQSILINGKDITIYIIVDDDKNLKYIKENLDFNIDFKYINNQLIQVIPFNKLMYKYSEYEKLSSVKLNNIRGFRNGFWENTLKRFFVIEYFMKEYDIKNIFHIENDVMLYENINCIYEKLITDKNDKIWVVQDSPNRAIASIIYIPTSESIGEFTTFVLENDKKDVFLNDMDLLGMFNNKYKFPIFPENQLNIVFDGAAIGQYLGGIDPANQSGDTTGFINQTCMFNPSMYSYSDIKIVVDHTNFVLKIPVVKIDEVDYRQIANIHVHSKKLYEFSSVFNIKKKDIISGDRILTLCDIVITTNEIFNYHRNIKNYIKLDKIIIIKDWENINYDKFNKIILDSGLSVVRIHVYTHLLNLFQKFLIPYMYDGVKYIIYTHNSDHVYDNTLNEILMFDKVERIYAQNANIKHPKITLLPIGIANDMWVHGDINSLFEVMTSTYYKKKINKLYININPTTFPYRKTILDDIKTQYIISKSKPYKEYLMELSTHMFSLCVRGNGIDTHRFWESLYLGVIPVIITNDNTDSYNFVYNLKNTNLPFVEISDILSKSKIIFDDQLYYKILKTKTFDGLKLSNY